jgi:GT2 family glycosyltransferase
MAKVSAIIPTWNRADLLASILSNLEQQTRKLDEVIVVDNGSSDNSQQIAREFNAKVIALPQNRGFAAAVNEGINAAGGDRLLILNNDVVLGQNWLEQLLARMEQENAPFAVGKLLRPDGPAILDGSWDLISRAAYAWRCGYGKPDGQVWSTARKIHFAPLTAALFDRQVFETIGLLETRFESYYEDVDFGIRCALAGLEGVYEPAAVATHLSKTTLGKSSARVYYLTARNQVFLLAKYYSTKTLVRFAWPILIGQLLALGAAAKQRNLFSALRGKWAALRNWSSFRAHVPLGTSHAGSLQVQTKVEQAFSESEQEIHTLQRQVGFDIYWRLYFSLVRTGL